MRSLQAEQVLATWMRQLGIGAEEEVQVPVVEVYPVLQVRHFPVAES